MSNSHVDSEARAKREFARKLKKIEKEARRKAIRDRDLFKGLQIAPTASFEDDAGGRQPGDANWTGFGFDIHPHVTFISALILIAFILLTLMFQKDASEFFKQAMNGITATSGWFLILTANIFILAAAYFAFGKFGGIRIGGRDAKPEFSTPAWYAMLLSAGMGIGLMFWSVGEPIYHYSSPSPMFNGLEALSPRRPRPRWG
ncbi:MAG: BCCT family transporter [Candidatus Thiodiazotropha sp.]